jgi:prepilin-type N-terminal cleavage/methylation domain-containing protein
MGYCRRSRGVTLIEAMIVVAIIGVLALLAVVGYRHWVRSAFVAEGQDMVSNIRSAEEAFLAENGAGYLDVSGNLGAGYTYPLQHPTNSKTAWGGACTWCKNPSVGWSGLNVASAAPLIFGYSVIADAAQPPSARVPTIQVNGGPLTFGNMGVNGAPWYFIEADANVSGDGVSFTHVYGMSGTNTIYVVGEGN